MTEPIKIKSLGDLQFQFFQLYKIDDKPVELIKSYRDPNGYCVYEFGEVVK